MSAADPLEKGAPQKAMAFQNRCKDAWGERVSVTYDQRANCCRIQCKPGHLVEIGQWLLRDLGFVFATLIADESQPGQPTLDYVFCDNADSPWAHVVPQLDADTCAVPSLVDLPQGPSLDWHEREVEDLFGIHFEGHPRLGEFILHEDWPEGVNPMRRDFDAHAPYEHREIDPNWEPPTIVVAPGAFAMPIGPVFSDFAESAHFLLETVGEDVIRTIPRFFYKYRGIEKLAEGQAPDRALLIAERFSGTSAFAHGLAFCRAVETICNVGVPARAETLRTIFAELERLRYHAAVITGICNSTALAVATSQAALIEEGLLRLTCEVAQHRYLFGMLAFGGLARDTSNHLCVHLADRVLSIARALHDLHAMLRFSSSFLDRLEEVGQISTEQALAYGLVGPIARASGIARDCRKDFPYAAYDNVNLTVAHEQEGDGYARLRVFFHEAEQSASTIHALAQALPDGPTCIEEMILRSGVALTAVEAPAGTAFHWLRLNDDGTVARYHITPPSFANWHGFHLAAENFAFQDFPIILASFGLWNAECDR